MLRYLQLAPSAPFAEFCVRVCSLFLCNLLPFTSLRRADDELPKLQLNIGLGGGPNDSAQHAVPGAEVTILNNATGQARRLVRNERGYYSAANLSPGSYEVTVSATGFKITLHNNLLIEVGQELVVDTQLQVGDVKETVQVLAEPTAVNSTSATLGNGYMTIFFTSKETIP